ncbi:AP180 N-terminal homology (ANTH) domain [Macleaya cordata]|uniref:AP180 N-terminal homology (ANTH) domain n=1 Tax=Macleaya cordata TaxID=56857 RepID=A0A200QAY2_MACCD|nr:AP180 N-terminal homology (ANTH) domain [Macleaya cordata]
MQRRFRQAYTALAGGLSDIDLILIKATSSDDLPLPEKSIHDLLKIFSFSPSSSSIRSFTLSFTRRFGKTRSWRVALKCLLLLHRLLRSLPQNNPFRSDLLWSRSNGFLSLYPCRFRDNSSSTGSKDFTVFIYSYARLLDEALDCFSIDSNNNNNTNIISDELQPFPSKSFREKKKEVERVVNELPQLQSLIDRVIQCNPLGTASRSLLIQSAMKQILRDSFVCYSTIRRGTILLLDNMFQMQYRSCISGFEIYKKAALQASRLSEFYDSCRDMGLCGSYEYPFIDRIPHIHVRALESFINGMWQLTESSSSSATSPSSSSMADSRSTSSITEDDGQRQLARLETLVSTEWEKFEEVEEEEKPLIQLDFNNNVGWEDLLEASACLPRVSRYQDASFYNFYAGYGYDTGEKHEEEDEISSSGGGSSWRMIQVYNNPNYSNPFYRPHNIIASNHYDLS